MEWIGLLEIGAAVITFILLVLVFKEIKSSIKASNEGKQSDRCDLD